LSKEEIEKKVGSLLDEYLASNDEEEASLSMKELDCADRHGDVLQMMITHVMEKKEDARTKVDKLLVHLVTAKVIESAGVVGGLTEMMGMVDDISMDVPKFGNYVARSMGLLAAAGSVPPEAVKGVLAPLERAPLMPKMLAWIIDTIHQEDAAKAKEYYGACGVTLVGSMMEGDQTDELAKEMLERSSMKLGHLVWMCETAA